MKHMFEKVSTLLTHADIVQMFDEQVFDSIGGDTNAYSELGTSP